jgi:hypothetical protein
MMGRNSDRAERGGIMPKYNVILPIVGEVHATVTADDEELAIDFVFENWYRCFKTEDLAEPGITCTIEDIDAVEKLHDGSVQTADEVQCEETDIDETA